jgi:2-phosphoglycerate kinase
MEQYLSKEKYRGYNALTIFTVFGYIACAIYGIVIIIAGIKNPIIWLIGGIGVGFSALGIYIFARIGNAVFITRDYIANTLKMK